MQGPKLKSCLALNTDAGEYCTTLFNDLLTDDHKGGASGGTKETGLWSTTTDAYCVAQFFIYHAEDLGKWVYGVNRYGSSSNVAAGLVDVPNYDGVKAFQYSIQRTSGDAVHGRKYVKTATTFGANPMFKQRGKYYGLCNNEDSSVTADAECAKVADNGATGTAVTSIADTGCPTEGIKICGTDNKTVCIYDKAASDTCPAARTAAHNAADRVAQQLFMGDGREDDSATTLSTVSVQTQKYTRCLVCHGSQEFTIPQAQSSGKIYPISH